MRRFQSIILGLFLGLWPCVVLAQVSMEVQLGLQRTVRLEKWNLVTVYLQNTGAPLTATLGVRSQRGSDFRKDWHVTTYTRTVELPHRSRKRFLFAVPITSITHPVEVFLRQKDRMLVQQQLNLRAALSAEHVILGLTSDLSLDFLATTFQRHTRVVYLPPRALPHTWSGYDAISALVVKGVSLQTMTEKQSTALRQWIARGGTLVVAGDSQYGLLQEPRMRDLLPVQVLGVQELDGLPAFATHYAEPLPPARLLAVRCRLQRGHVLVGTTASPLLVERRFGNGRVVFLAVDYATRPLLGWPGNKALWHDILQPGDAIDFGRVFAELGLLDDSHPIIKLLRRPLFSYPSHPMLSLFLLIYGGGLGLLFWRMGKRGIRLGRYWIGVLLVILAATGVAYGLLSEPLLRHPAFGVDLTTMEVLADTGYTHVRGYVGLFSPRGGSYGLTFQHPETVLRHTFHRGRGHAGPDIEITLRESFAIRGVSLDPWMLRIFSVESMASAPMRVKTWRHATGLTMQVENIGTLPLQGLMVVYHGMLFPLGSLAPGKDLFEDVYIPLRASESDRETIWQALFKRRPVSDDTRLTYFQEVVLQHYFGEKRLAETYEAPFLAAWLAAPGTLQKAADGLPIKGVTFVVSRLPG